jgi:hypothetical protein
MDVIDGYKPRSWCLRPQRPGAAQLDFWTVSLNPIWTTDRDEYGN